MSHNNSKLYARKEWMHPEDMDLENPSNHVLYLKHLKAYEYVLPMVEGKKILEIGCGSGYGNKLLATKAKKILSIDIDKESIEFAKKINPSANIEYELADVTKGISPKDNSYDICVCFQVIEHIQISKLQDFLGEINRVIKPGGSVLFTTPNRKIRLFPFQKPTNKYHVTEYTSKGLRNLLEPYYAEVKILGMQAEESLKQLEIKRAKSTFYSLFILKPIKSILKIFGIQGAILKSNRKDEPRIPGSKNHKLFHTKNFWLDEACPDDSIDLMASCINY